MAGSLGLVGSEVAGADEDIAGIGLPSGPRGSIVLAIREQQVDTDRGWLRLERIGEAEEERHAGRPVVRAGHREALLAEVLALVRVGPRVPVGEEQDPLRGGRSEPGEEVAQVQDLMGSGLESNLLDHNRVGRGAEPLEDPIAGALVGGRAGDAWPELHLLLEIGEGALTGELARAARPAACGTGEAEREAGCRAPEAALSDGHRVVMSCRDLDFGI